MKRIDVSELVSGQEYYVECGIWSANVKFVHSAKKGKHTYYRFTFGSVDNWFNQFNIYAPKSKLKIYKEI